MSERDFNWRAGVPAAAAILATGLHSWPVADVPAMRLLWPVNVVLLAWLGWVLPCCLCRHSRSRARLLFPPACLWAYVVVCVLSVAAAEDMGRSLTAAAKTSLCVIGGYSLARAGLQSPLLTRALPLLWACTISVVLVHATAQVVAGLFATALFESPLKLGSFAAMTVPMSATLLVARPGFSHRLWAALLVVGGLVLCPSAWAWVGIVTGTVVGTGFVARRWLATTLLVAAGAVSVVGLRPGGMALIQDAQIREIDGTDLRQRYLEWQALINLLEDRGAAGTGIGCMNDLRSQYYFRLPKRNTIAAFDQNGYLATAAELGIPGLIIFCWVCVEYLARGWRGRGDPLVRAAHAGLVGGLFAQFASSLAYNGILIVLVVILATIDYAEGEGQHATA